MEMSLILIAIIIFLFIFGTLIGILYARLNRNEEEFARYAELTELEERLRKEIESLRNPHSSSVK